MALVPGARLGPYEVTAQIGAGGMGEVYRATDTRLDRTVAIKVLPEHVATDPNLKQRFEREAKALAALSHSHICPIHDVGRQNGIDFLVMEYLNGETLEQRLKKGALPLDQALQIGIQIADALAAAHRAGIIHRDLKPGNVMLTKSGAKLLDFGLAKTGAPAVAGSLSILPTTPPGQTQPGMILGTFQYMAPEQLEGQEADTRTDIFAFGAVVYEMVTGKKAFEGKSQASLIGAIMHAEPAPITSLRPLVPPAIDLIVKRCLAKDPNERWQAASDVSRLLELPTEGAGPARSSWRERTGWIAAAAILLGALSYFGFLAEPTVPTGRKVVLGVNAPNNATFIGPPNVTIPVPVFALSSDGQSLVFSAATTGARPTLWLRPIGEVNARVLPGTEDAQQPFWSPDGGWIAFFAEGKLKKIPATGGPVQVVLDEVPDPRGGSWGLDNTILIGSGGGTPILRVGSSGGAATAVTQLDASRKEASHRWPVWLPDGRHFLFTARSNSVENSGVYLGSFDAPPQRLSIRWDGSTAYASGYVLFLAGDTLLGQRLDANRLELSGQPITIAGQVGTSSNGLGAFSAADTGVLAYAATLSRNGRPIWFDREGNQVGAIEPEGEYVDVRLAPDDKRLAVSLVDPKTGNPDIWLTDLTRGGTSRFTFGPRLNIGPIWSPDGARIVFRTTRNGGQVEFYQRSSSSGGTDAPVLLAETQRAVSGPSLNVVISDWSPDARHLLYSLNTTSRTDLWLLALVGDQKPVEFLASQSDKLHGTFSPDGRLVAYSSNESGRFEVYVQTFPLSDRKWSVSTTGGYEPRWRADGREIYYLSEDRKLMAVSVGAGPSFDIPKPLFQTRVTEQVTAYRTHYAPNRDGTRFLVITQSSETPPTPITVVLNWQEELKQRVPTR